MNLLVSFCVDGTCSIVARLLCRLGMDSRRRCRCRWKCMWPCLDGVQDRKRANHTRIRIETSQQRFLQQVRPLHESITMFFRQRSISEFLFSTTPSGIAVKSSATVNASLCIQWDRQSIRMICTEWDRQSIKIRCIEWEPFSLKFVCSKGPTVTRAHDARYYSCVSALGGGPGRAPLRPAAAAELGARRHCRPRRSCRLPEREPLLRHQPGSAHSSSAKPFSTKAQYLLMGRTLRSRPTRPPVRRVS